MIRLALRVLVTRGWGASTDPDRDGLRERQKRPPGTKKIRQGL